MRLLSRQLVVKEFKDLVRDPRIWIPFILSAVIMPAMGLAISTPMRTAVERVEREYLNAVVVNLDRGTEALRLIEFMRRESDRLRIRVLELPPVGGAGDPSSREFIEGVARRAEASYPDAEAVVVFPPDFSARIGRGDKAEVVIITIVREVSFFAAPPMKAERLSGSIESYIRRRLLEGTGLDPEAVTHPLQAVEASYLIGKKALLVGGAMGMLYSLALGSILVPVILVMVSVTIMQMTATSMAVENEEKTLETLLTLPLSKTQILLSKLVGSFLVAAIGSALSVAGFLVYMLVLIQPAAGGPVLGMPQPMISPVDALYIAASLVATTFFTAAVGVVIGALSSDARIAGTIVGPLSMGVFVPGFIVAFTDLSELGPAAMLLRAVPLTQPIILAKMALSASLPLETPVYIVASVVITVAVIAVTARIFSLETLSTIQYKLSRLRRRP